MGSKFQGDPGEVEDFGCFADAVPPLVKVLGVAEVKLGVFEFSLV